MSKKKEEIETRQTKKDQKQNKLKILPHPRPSLFGAFKLSDGVCFMHFSVTTSVFTLNWLKARNIYPIVPK